MADVIVNPVPTSGRDFQYNMMVSHYCQMSSTKLLNVVVQSNPNYIYAYVTNLTNMKTGTFSSAAGPMRVILAGSASVPSSMRALRLTKLSATRALLMVMGTGSTNTVQFYVVEITSGDDLIVKNASLTTGVLSNTSPYIYIINASSYSNTSAVYDLQGSVWQFFPVRDNVVFVADRDTASGSVIIRLRKIVYDPNADTLTNTLLTTYTAPNPQANLGNRSFTRMDVQDIPGSTSKLFTIRAHLTTVDKGATMAGSSIVYAAIVTDTDVVTPLAGTLPASLQALAPLSTTTILGFTTTKSYYTWNGSAWNGTAANFSANGGTNTIVQAFALDANYFMLFSAALGTADLASSSNTMAVRVGRYIDAGSGQTSTATASGDGASLGTVPCPIVDGNFIVRDGTDAYHLFGRPSMSNSTSANLAPSIKTIYQQGG